MTKHNPTLDSQIDHIYYKITELLGVILLRILTTYCSNRMTKHNPTLDS
jgi:hypothetical protein